MKMAGAIPAIFVSVSFRGVVPAKAGTHTPRLFSGHSGRRLFVTTNAGGYGSRFRGDDIGRESCLQPQLLLALAERAQPQGVEFDEARGVTVVVGDRAFLEGDEILIVQRILALAAYHDDVALVEFQP